MVIAFSVILIGLLLLIKPLQRNTFYVLHCAIVILSAYYVETHYFRIPPLLKNYSFILYYKTFLLFLVFHFVSINIVTVLAYWKDKRAAVNGSWRIPEIQLHTLELLGGWSGAFLAQKMFRHKTKKKSFRAVFWLMLVFQLIVLYAILTYLRLV